MVKNLEVIKDMFILTSAKLGFYFNTIQYNTIQFHLFHSII